MLRNWAGYLAVQSAEFVAPISNIDHFYKQFTWI